MGIRTSYNSPLGMPRFDRVADDPQGIALGTILKGFEDNSNVENEYIWLRSPAGIVPGTDVTYDANFLATAVAADAGQADAIVASGANQYAWFMLKPRHAGA